MPMGSIQVPVVVPHEGIHAVMVLHIICRKAAYIRWKPAHCQGALALTTEAAATMTL